MNDTLGSCLWVWLVELVGVKRTRLLSGGGGNVESIGLVGSASVANRGEVRAVVCDVVWLEEE